MFNIHHWKVYDAHYGDKSRLGNLMIQAQVSAVLVLFVITHVAKIVTVLCNYSS